MKLWNVICKLQYYTYIQQKCGQNKKAKWNQSQEKQHKTKTKSQESSEAKAKSKKPKAKSQIGMQIGSKLQQIARKLQMLAPKCSKYKPEARNRRSQKPKAKWACKLAPNCSK